MTKAFTTPTHPLEGIVGIAQMLNHDQFIGISLREQEKPKEAMRILLPSKEGLAQNWWLIKRSCRLRCIERIDWIPMRRVNRKTQALHLE